jgi:hypothetical protein
MGVGRIVMREGLEAGSWLMGLWDELASGRKLAASPCRARCVANPPSRSHR